MYARIGLWEVRHLANSCRCAVTKAVLWDDDAVFASPRQALADAMVRMVLCGAPEIAPRREETAREVFPLGQLAQHTLLGVQQNDGLDLVIGSRVVGNVLYSWLYDAQQAVKEAQSILPSTPVYACRYVDTISVKGVHSVVLLSYRRGACAIVLGTRRRYFFAESIEDVERIVQAYLER